LGNKVDKVLAAAKYSTLTACLSLLGIFKSNVHLLDFCLLEVVCSLSQN
jgi:hypothetical protein